MIELQYESRLAEGVSAYLREVERAAVEEATVDALTRVARKGRTRWAKFVRADINLPAETVNASMRPYRATPERWTASVWTKSRKLPLGRFPVDQGRTSAHVTLYRGERPVPYRGMFVAVMPSGRVGVFYRKGGSRRGTARRVKSGPNRGRWYRPALPIAEETIKYGVRELAERTKPRAVAFAESITASEFEAARARALRKHGLATAA